MSQLLSQPRSASTLTPQQLKVYDFILRYRADNSISPTLQEIADSMGIGKVTVYDHVRALIKKRFLTDTPHKSRSLMPNVDALPPDEALRSGVADVAARLGALHETMGKQGVMYFSVVASIRSDLLALLSRGGAKS